MGASLRLLDYSLLSEKKGMIVVSVTLFVSILAFLIISFASGKVSAQSPTICQTSSGTCLPEIVKIETNYDHARVYIRDCGELCKDVIIAYSKDPTSAPSEIRTAPSYDSNSGLLVSSVTALDTNSSYYFRVKCADEEKCKAYSGTQEVRMAGCVMVYDGITKNIPKVSCEEKINKNDLFTPIADNWNTKLNTVLKYSIPVFALAFGISIFLLVTKKDKCHKFKTRPRNIYRSRTAKV